MRNLLDLVSNSKSNKDCLRISRGDDGKLYAPRSQLKSTILFYSPVCDHSRVERFIKSQKWLQKSGYNIEVAEGTFNFLGTRAIEELDLGVFVQFPWDVLCGAPARLKATGAAAAPTVEDVPTFTIGGILLIESRLYCMTVGHILDHSRCVKPSREQVKDVGETEKPELEVGRLVQSTWSDDAGKTEDGQRNRTPNCDWAIIRLNNSQVWPANPYLTKPLDRGQEQGLASSNITRFASQADINDRELVKHGLSIISGCSGIVSGRLRVTPVPLYLRGNLFIAREVITQVELRELSRTSSTCNL